MLFIFLALCFIFYFLVSAIDRNFQFSKSKPQHPKQNLNRFMLVFGFYTQSNICKTKNTKPKPKIQNQAQSDCNFNVIFINSLQSVPVHFSEIKTTEQHNATEFCWPYTLVMGIKFSGGKMRRVNILFDWALWGSQAVVGSH